VPAGHHLEHDAPRILVIGGKGAGKTSFISSIVSSLRREIVYTSPIGEIGDETSTTKWVRVIMIYYMILVQYYYLDNGIQER
jgi:GTPase SAR1 family protein